jgi:hypothetical protein
MTYKINYNNILNMDWVRRVRRATFDLLSLQSRDKTCRASVAPIQVSVLIRHYINQTSRLCSI